MLSSMPVLFYATATPERVRHIQSKLGVEHASAVIEGTLARIAQMLVGEASVARLVVAGGETSGAVVKALGISALRIGPQIEPGVPWTFTEGRHRILLALKSGNFGSVDFFDRSLAQVSN